MQNKYLVVCKNRVRYSREWPLQGYKSFVRCNEKDWTPRWSESQVCTQRSSIMRWTVDVTLTPPLWRPRAQLDFLDCPWDSCTYAIIFRVGFSFSKFHIPRRFFVFVIHFPNVFRMFSTVLLSHFLVFSRLRLFLCRGHTTPDDALIDFVTISSGVF